MKYEANEWIEVRVRMYGKWLPEQQAKDRLAGFIAQPNLVSDNRYLHIKY